MTSSLLQLTLVRNTLSLYLIFALSIILLCHNVEKCSLDICSGGYGCIVGQRVFEYL